AIRQFSPIITPDSMTVNAPTVVPAPKRASGCTKAVGWIIGLLKPHFLSKDSSLQGLQTFPQLRQATLIADNARGLTSRRGRREKVCLVAFHVGGRAALASHAGSGSHSHSVTHTYLPAQHRALLNRRGTRQSHLSTEDDVLFHPAIMADMHQVIELGPLLNKRLRQSRAIHRATSADPNIVLNHERSDLGHLLIYPL